MLRFLSRGRGGFKSRGRIKSSWIARLFDVSIRRVEQARKELVDLGWILPEPTDQWAENQWGRVFHIDLEWASAVLPDARRLPPPPATDSSRMPPLDLDLEPLREFKHQEPASGGPAGVEIVGKSQRRPSELIALTIPAGVPTPPQPEGDQKLDDHRPAPVANEVRNSRVSDDLTSSIRRGSIVVSDRSGARPLPVPRLEGVKAEDLKDTGRLLDLLDQAIDRRLMGPSDADRLRFVSAAEHAQAVGQSNPCGLFVKLVRERLWGYLTQEDEDRANARIKQELRGEATAGQRIGSLTNRAASAISGDALIVREVRSAMIRAGMFRDPFPAFQRLNPGWTRERWEQALAELGYPG